MWTSVIRTVFISSWIRFRSVLASIFLRCCGGEGLPGTKQCNGLILLFQEGMAMMEKRQILMAAAAFCFAVAPAFAQHPHGGPGGGAGGSHGAAMSNGAADHSSVHGGEYDRLSARRGNDLPDRDWLEQVELGKIHPGACTEGGLQDREQGGHFTG